MTQSETIILAVISGIVSYSVVFLCLEVFKKILVPWYQSTIYQGQVISGVWLCENDKLGQSVTIELTQSAYKIRGIATVTLVGEESKRRNSAEPTRVFHIEGFILGKTVQLNLRMKRRDRIGMACLLMELIEDGRKMKGVVSYYSTMESRILPMEETYQLQGNN